jgi:hypothetical protein
MDSWRVLQVTDRAALALLQAVAGRGIGLQSFHRQRDFKQTLI